MKVGSWEEVDAESKGKAYFKKLLPDGLNTEGHRIFTINDNNEKIGILWLHVFEKSNVLKSFIYDIKIDEAFRGKGYGTDTMEALDEYCKSHSIESIQLHVFGHNKIAYALYEKMGFQTTHYYMEKEL
nr:GNAT family N-acetyltransferase [Mammaliicoccus sp. Marseille-Q6498]